MNDYYNNANYCKKTTPVQYDVRNAFTKILSENIGGNKGLDLGCGAGHYTTFISKYLSHVVGIDSSQNAISNSIQNPNVNYFKLDLNDINNVIFKKIEEFDYIQAICLLEFLDDPDSFLKYILDKFNGKFIIVSPNVKSLNFFFFRLLVIIKCLIFGKKKYIKHNGFNTQSCLDVISKYSNVKYKKVQAVKYPVYIIDRFPEIIQKKILKYTKLLFKNFQGGYDFIIIEKN